MNINRENYEAFLLDYLESNLSPAQVAELMVFLEMNPDLKEALEGFEMMTLNPDDSVSFPDKNSLKKQTIAPHAGIGGENYEEMMIASVEGLLSGEEEEDLKIFLGLNPGLQKEMDLLLQTRLSPDLTIIYPGKSALKRSAFGVLGNLNRTWLYSGVAVAASITILITLFINLEPTVKKAEMAQSSPRIEKQQPLAGPAPSSKKTTSDKTGAISGSGAVAVNSSTAGDHKTNMNASGETAVYGKPYQPSILPPEYSEMTLLAYQPAPSLPVNPPMPAIDELSDFRTANIELFGYLQERESREYMEYMAVLDSKPWYSKAARKVRTLFTGEEIYDPEGIERQNTLWMLAEAGLKGVNYVTNSNLRLDREVDEDGRTIAYAVASNRIQYAGKPGK